MTSSALLDRPGPMVFLFPFPISSRRPLHEKQQNMGRTGEVELLFAGHQPDPREPILKVKIGVIQQEYSPIVLSALAQTLPSDSTRSVDAKARSNRSQIKTGLNFRSLINEHPGGAA